MLEAELENDLGYSKYDYKNKETPNSRNGHSKKTLRSDYGKLDIDVPRDREGQFEPAVVKKIPERCILDRRPSAFHVRKRNDNKRHQGSP